MPSVCLQLCRFSDAGNDRRSAHSGGRRLKSAKGTKSREVARRSGSERYEDLMLAPTSVARAPLMRSNVHVAQDSTWHLGGDAECISERWTASGREAAIRIAERFHNFCVSV
jgi:hypothetical protein